jgi:N-methylhydantoinase A
MDIAHEHETFLSLPLELPYFDKINQGIDTLRKAALRDLRLEGIALEDITFSLELELSLKLFSFTALVSFPKLSFQSETDIEFARQALTEAYRAASLNGYDPTQSQIVLETVKLRSYCPVGHSQLQPHPWEGENPESALKKARRAYWEGSFRDTSVFEQKLLRNGNVVKGPAIIEGEETTILIPEGSRYSVDEYLFGLIEEDK